MAARSVAGGQSERIANSKLELASEELQVFKPLIAIMHPLRVF